MGIGLRVVLIVFGIFWFILVTSMLRKNKLPVKYSIFWYVFVFVILILGIIPDVLQLICDLFGFATLSNLIIGAFLTMLMFITLILTTIISNQKKQIKLLIQEVSLLKSEKRTK